MATHSSILAWKNLIDRGAWQASSWGPKVSDTTEHIHTPPRTIPCMSVLSGEGPVLLPHGTRLQVVGHEAGWRKLLWSGPVPGCSHPREGSRKMEGPGSGQGPAAWLLVVVGARVRGPSVENIFPTPIALGQEGASLSLLREGDYRSELQSMLNLANC